MNYVVLQTLSGLYLIVLAIMFIGYWTYADYYTKLNGSFRTIFWGCSAAIMAFSAEITLITYFTKDAQTAIRYGIHIMGYCLLILGAGFVMWQLGEQFEKSRKYFGSKRNKL